MNRLRWTALALGLVPAGGAGVWYFFPERHSFYTDADSIREPVASVNPRDVLWQSPAMLDVSLNTDGEDYEPRLSWDGMTLFFVRGKAGEGADIFFSTRSPAGWSAPQPLIEVNSADDDFGPEPTADGRSLYFYSNRPGGLGGHDIWVSKREGEQWLSPVHLGPEVNSEFNDYGPAVSPDGKTLYFASNRPVPDEADQPSPDAWTATVREDLFHRTYDLYEAEMVEGVIRPATRMTTLNTPGNEGAPCVSPSGDFLYFSSDRPGGAGGFDIYRSRRARSGMLPPGNLGRTVNTLANELDPGLTALGYGLYFSSDRPVESQDAEPSHDYNLYYAASREVYLDIEERSRPPINWAAIWRELGPNAMWSGLALLLLLLLFRLLKEAFRRRLSLITRCLLASLMVHAALMFFFQFWEVGAAVAGVVRRGGGPIQVSLGGGGSSGHAIVAQVRGPLTDIAVPSVRAIEMERQNGTPIMAVSPIRTEFALHETAPDLALASGVMIRVLDSPSKIDAQPTPHETVHLPSEPMLLSVSVPKVSQPVTEGEAVAQMSRSSFMPRQQTPTASALIMPQGAVLTEIKPTHTQVTFDSNSLVDEEAMPTSTSPAIQFHSSLMIDQPIGGLGDDAIPFTLPGLTAPVRGTEVENQAGISVPISGSAEGSRVLAPISPVSPVMENAATMHPESYSPNAGFGESSMAATHVVDESRPTLPATSPSLTRDIPSWSSGEIGEPRLPMGPTHNAAASTGEEDVNFVQAPFIATASRAPVHVGLGIAAPAGSNFGKYSVEAMPNAVFDNTSLISGFVTTSEPPIPGSMAESRFPRSAQELAPLHELALSLPRTTDEALGSGGPSDDSGLVSPGESIGRLYGSIRDATTDAPLAGAAIRLDLPDRPPITVVAGSDGRYELEVPPMPTNFAVSATHDGYVPSSENVSSSSLRDREQALDFELDPRESRVIAVEAAPDVHHLGNDRFEGRINSQFQKESEGRSFHAEFSVEANQAFRPSERVRLSVMVKGIQCPHEVRINDLLIESRLSRAPRDGSFGEFRLSFEGRLLQVGTNTIEIRAVECTGDLDDFEFVNIRIEPISTAPPSQRE